jgi:PAS domain S-box-containing protein
MTGGPNARGVMLPSTASALEFFAEVIEQLPHPMFVKDREFRYVLLNSALLRLSGHGLESILGKTDYDFLPKETADFYRERDVEVFATAAEVTVAQEVLTDRGGQRRVLATRKVPLRGPDSEVTHLIGIVTDITRLKEVEEDLRLSTEQLEHRVAERTRALALAQEGLVRKERLAVLGLLAGGVAHQIRNPLGAIKNASYILDRRLRQAEGLLAEPGARDDVSHALEVIHDEVQRANQIITDLLDYARIRVPVRRLTSIAYVVEQAFGAQSVPANIDVVRRLPDLPDIAVDGDHVQGALFNLLRNAIEAMPNGGTLTIGASARDGSIVVSIDDTGGGIAAEVRDRLFEPLVTTKPLGLGLGLVTARTLIEGQGGTVACAASGAHGTRFEVVLPSAPAD